MRDHVQLTVGVFINLGIILFSVAVLALGSSRALMSRTNHYYVMSPNAEGLIKGATVMLAGVSVGTVSDFELKPGPKPVKITLSIDSEHSELIRIGTSAEIATAGLVGERILSITPGPANNPLLPPDQEIPFQKALDLSRVATKAEALIGKVDRLVTDLNRVVVKVDRGSGTISGFLNDPGLYDNAKAIFGEANENRIVRNLVRKAVRDAEEEEAKESAEVSSR